MFPTENVISREYGGGGNRTRETFPPVSRRYRDRRNYEERMADPIRAARWRAQKRQWWREHRAKWPVKVRVAP